MVKINSGEGLLLRQREVMRLLSRLAEEGLNFVVVGGYAVSVFLKRFSVDLDIVVKEQDLEKFQSILSKEGYFSIFSKKIEGLYGENFKRYEKKINNFSVDVDLLISGMISRGTNASWSYEFIAESSESGKIEETYFKIPKKELLIATKLHAGRISDIRDIVALSENIKLEEIKKLASRGDMKKLKIILKKGLEFLISRNFQDSFKGIFGVANYQIEKIKLAEQILSLF